MSFRQGVSSNLNTNVFQVSPNSISMKQPSLILGGEFNNNEAILLHILTSGHLDDPREVIPLLVIALTLADVC